MTSTTSPVVRAVPARAPARAARPERAAQDGRRRGRARARRRERPSARSRGRRAPGIGTTTGESSSSQASATSAGVASRRAAIVGQRGAAGERAGAARAAERRVRDHRDPELLAALDDPAAERAVVVDARARPATAAIGSELERLVELVAVDVRDPDARARGPRRASRASARTEVRHGVRGSGAWIRYRSIGRPSSAARLASQSAQDRLRAAVRHPPAAGPGHPALGDDPRARGGAAGAGARAASSRSLWPSSASSRP